VKEWKKATNIQSPTLIQKEAGMAAFISDKVDFRTKTWQI
jgi:hypothetical protein